FGHPYDGLSMDLAFVITGTTQPETIKWVQYPDLTDTGLDVDATWDGMWPAQILADDFNCVVTGPITDIHIWGSWYWDELPYRDANMVDFTLSIHEDIPVDPFDPCSYSMPGDVLWLWTFLPGDFDVSLYASDLYEGWFVPCTSPPIHEPFADSNCWQYDFYIDPCDAFWQWGSPDDPCVYWLDVQAMPWDDMTRFGWKTSLDHWNDDAVWAQGYEPWFGPWFELIYPIDHELAWLSMDLAFMITTEEQPEPKPPTPHLKWSQPPIEIDPNLPDPVYCGWDEPSWTSDPCDEFDFHIAADDFRCLGTMPITSVHWWGSYIGWEDVDPPPDVPITGWLIRFYSNIPAVAGADPNYSHPDLLLWEVLVDASRVQVEWVGNDFFPEPMFPPDTCFQYYVDLYPPEWFWQHDYNDMTEDQVFWISIQAVYGTVGADPLYPWGWKTRPCHWMDDAVRYQCRFVPPANVICRMWPIKDPIWGESFDLSFELDTDPNYIKWEQPFTGIRHWPHYEDEESMATEDAAGNVDILRLVADDWRCDANTPITAAVWWGSYIGYQHEACTGPPTVVPVKPDYFLLNIWTDVPAIAGFYSHPNDIIWEYRAYDYDEVCVGYDKHPEFIPGPAREPVFRYSVRIPEPEQFCQEEPNTVYWFSVVAVYLSSSEVMFPWGWTNHEHFYNDDAVEGWFDSVIGIWIWTELFDQTGESEDMSFILFTDPNECGQPEELDYGDAPDPCYPTLLVNGGARHVITGPWLDDGSGTDSPDPEPDGQPDGTATGDDLDGNDDEDAITIAPSPLVPGGVAFISFTVAGGPGCVDGWIDWNQNGSWEAAEAIPSVCYAAAGPYVIVTPVPLAAVPGTTYARFRMSSVGGLSPTGLASDGEVEDHEVQIEQQVPEPKPPTPHLKWSQPPIEFDPNLPTPVYCGWDEPSWTSNPDDLFNFYIAADDFRCLGTMPITS
ncbi:MAG: DUF7901 domain-containing protein, partial [Planctomycetota bacterium]